MSDFHRDYINPLDLINSYWSDVDISHIEYDSDLKVKDSDYCRIEQGGHDGTLLFTIELLQKSLLPLLNKSTYHISVDMDKVKDIKYKIGKIRLSTVFGMVNLRCGRYPGQVERVRIPVVCEYIY